MEAKQNKQAQMPANSKTIEIARKVLTQCMGAQTSETVLIITDGQLLELGQDFLEAGRLAGLETTLVIAPISEKGEPALPVAAAMQAADVQCLLTSMSYSHVNARIAASQKGARIASMPTITREIIEHYLDVDYMSIKQRSDRLAQLLTEASLVRVSTAAGTDLTFSLAGRKGISDNGDLKTAGTMSNLPAGEAYAAPQEQTGDGILVVDGCISYLGAIDTPVTLLIKAGHICEITGGKHAARLEAFLSDKDAEARGIAEFGIGTNETAVITGHPLVDEKILGTIHIAFGMNRSMGGSRQSDIHYDCIIKAPTVWLDGKMILDQGQHIYL